MWVSLVVRTNIRLSGFLDHRVLLSRLAHTKCGESACSLAQGTCQFLNGMKISESVSLWMRARWRIRIDFQEGKFLFKNRNAVYTVLFARGVRKIGKL